jgi:tetrahydromethanopterin S-methyltransferase subunit F
MCLVFTSSVRGYLERHERRSYMNRGIIGTIIGVLVIIILVIVILQLT